MIAGIAGIDGDEIEAAQILASGEARRLEFGQLCLHAAGELVGDAVRVNGDQAQLALIMRIAQRLHHARLGHAVAAGAHQVEADQVAVLRPGGIARLHRPLLELFAVDGIDHTAAAGVLAINAELPALFLGQPFDAFGLVAVARHVGGRQPGQARQDAVTLPERRLRRAPRASWLQQQNARLVTFRLIPDRGFGHELAIGVAGDDLEHGHVGQMPPLLEGLSIAADQPGGAHLAQQLLQGKAIAALDPKGAGDLALADLASRRAHELKDGVFAWQCRGRPGLFELARHRLAVLVYSAASRVPLPLRALPLPAFFGFALGAGLAALALPLLPLVPRRLLGLLGPLATRSAISSTASAKVSAAGSFARGRVALTSPCLT